MENKWGAKLTPTQSQTQYFEAVRKNSVTDFQLPMEMGEYTIDQLIGRGGMGVVFSGTHRRMQRRVAIKVVSSAAKDQEESEQQFLAEIRVVARLLHPRIVTAFDAGQFDQMVYLVMEYVEGGTLVDLLHQEGPLSVPRALSLIHQAADGLGHAHLNSIIHRDVKPGNMMIASDGTLKVLDLGLASFVQETVEDEDEPQSNPICGTPEFMAPEQFEGVDVGEPADIYALGCTLYFLLTGTAPYTGGPVAQLRAHCTAPIPQVSKIRSDVPSVVENLIGRMMAKDVGRRLDSMDDVKRMIEEIQSSIGPDPSQVSGSAKQHDHALANSLSLSTNNSKDPLADLRGDASDAPTRDINQWATLAVDLGGRFFAAAVAKEDNSVQRMAIGRKGRGVTSSSALIDQQQLFIGEEAVKKAEQIRLEPRRVIDLLQDRIDDDPSNRSANPAIPLSMLVQQIRSLSIDQLSDGSDDIGEPPVMDDLLLCVPSCFGQMTRQRLIAAASAGSFTNIRLLDRGLAAALTQFQTGGPRQRPTLKSTAGYWLVITIDDLSMEISLLGVSTRRVQMVAVAGNRRSGQPRWNRRLRRYFGRQLDRLSQTDTSDGSSLSESQLDADHDENWQKTRWKHRIDLAIDALVSRDHVPIRLPVGGRHVKAELTSRTLLNCCSDLLEELGCMLGSVLAEGGVDGEEVSSCLVLGGIAHSEPVKNLLSNFGIDASPTTLTQPQLACAAGTAVILEQLPSSLRPRLVPCLSHDLGLVFAASDGSDDDQVEMLIPRLTALPASAKRSFETSPNQSQQITLVQSDETTDTKWMAFERIEFDGLAQNPVVGAFEVNQEARIECRFNDELPRREEFGTPSPDEMKRLKRLLNRSGPDQ